AIEQAVILARSSHVDFADLRISERAKVDDQVRFAAERKMSLEELERAYIIEILKLTRGNMGKTADILGIHRKTLLEKRKKYKIDEQRATPRARAAAGETA